jgi:O-antigen/teichoic acid export membrane protein
MSTMNVFVTSRLWMQRISFTLLDQAFISGTNFIVQVVLAQSLSASEYGAFSVGFNIFLALATIHYGLIQEPMAVFGPEHGEEAMSRHLAGVAMVQGVLSLAIGIAIVGLRVAISDSNLRLVILGMGMTAPMMLTFWFLRRACFVRERPGAAASASAVYAVASLAQLLILGHLGLLGPRTAAVLMGLAAVVASAGIWYVPNIHFARVSVRETVIHAYSIARTYWGYGRWIVLSGVLSLAVMQLQVFLAAGLLGLEEAGALQVAVLLTNPMLQVVVASYTLFLPVLVTRYTTHGLPSMQHAAHAITVGLTVTSILYVVVICILIGPFHRLLYDEKFTDIIWLVPITSLGPVFMSLTSGPSLMLRAQRRSGSVLAVSAVVAFTGLVSGVLLTLHIGVYGAAMSIVLAQASGYAMTLYIWLTSKHGTNQHVRARVYKTNVSTAE